MAITKIKVSNFKSFDELEVDLRPLNIVIGANAAGKSSFLEIFRFIRDVSRHGAENGAIRPARLEAPVCQIDPPDLRVYDLLTAAGGAL